MKYLLLFLSSFVCTGCAAQETISKIGDTTPYVPGEQELTSISYESTDMTPVKVGLMASKDTGGGEVRMLIPRAYFTTKPRPGKVLGYGFSIASTFDDMQPLHYSATQRTVLKNEIVRAILGLRRIDYSKEILKETKKKYSKDGETDDFMHHILNRNEVLKEEFFFPKEPSEHYTLFYECISYEVNHTPSCVGYAKVDHPQLKGKSEIFINYFFDRSLLTQWRILDAKVKDLVRSFIVDEWPEGTPMLAKE